jgi:hypothetical protein
MGALMVLAGSMNGFMKHFHTRLALWHGMGALIVLASSLRIGECSSRATRETILYGHSDAMHDSKSFDRTTCDRRQLEVCLCVSLYTGVLHVLLRCCRPCKLHLQYIRQDSPSGRHEYDTAFLELLSDVLNFALL